jgi:hypothetical protein
MAYRYALELGTSLSKLPGSCRVYSITRQPGSLQTRENRSPHESTVEEPFAINGYSLNNGATWVRVVAYI